MVKSEIERKWFEGLTKLSPLIEGHQIYHNYIRPHEALNGKTPTGLAGIKVKGKDKWLTIIQNATRTTPN
jgi:hypothetical protein